MPITKISIKNYKSLKNLSLNLKPFMVFVGPNNSGKSNILDAFHFLADLIGNHDFQATIKRRGGSQQILFNGGLEQTISVELNGKVNIDGKDRKYKYVVQLEGNEWGNCKNKKEILTLLENEENVLLNFPSKDDMANAFDETGKKIGGFGGGSERLYLSQFTDRRHYPIISQLAQDVRSWAFFNLLPPLMRESLPVQRKFDLESSGHNLAVVLHTLQAEDPQRFKEIEDILRTAIPELEELTTALTNHEPGQTYIRIREKSLQTATPAWGMSDGTLRLLGYLATLYSPSPPSLVCFEEPENYVHPQLLEMLIELLRNASLKMQVLVTTHSPYLVDLLQPSDLYIVEKKKGETLVKDVKSKKAIKDALKVLGLGELWYSGSLGGVP